MIFDNCRWRISEITDEELKGLIGNQEENLWIDFKQQSYHQDPQDPEKYKYEICKDVTAMANAEGGYILVGVHEKGGLAQGFFTVAKPGKVVQSINGVCLQYIDPRIQNLEVKKRSFEWNGKEIDLVIIHIPPSDHRPHGFRIGSTHFVKRYGDHTREYPMSELAAAFSLRHYPPIMDQIDDKLNAILRDTRRDRRSSMSPQEDALEQEEVKDLLHLMKLRFEEEISDEPYYRIIAVPTTLNPDAVCTEAQEIRDIFENPPEVRPSGFGVKGALEILPSPEGIRSTKTRSDQELTLLHNGFLELRGPLSSAYFQWGKENKGISADVNWLFPYPVCEYPVTFMMLVKAIYSAAGIDSEILVQQEYRNLSGFLLVGGHPANPLFGEGERFQRVYKEPHAIGRPQTIEPDFIPDRVAYGLVKELYASFRLGVDLIPFFDADRNFVP